MSQPDLVHPDLPEFVAKMNSDSRRRWNRERVLVDDERAEASERGRPVHDDEGREIVREYPIRTHHVPQVTPAPPDHPARLGEPSLLVPKPGDLSDLIRATEMPGRG